MNNFLSAAQAGQSFILRSSESMMPTIMLKRWWNRRSTTYGRLEISLIRSDGFRSECVIAYAYRLIAVLNSIEQMYSVLSCSGHGWNRRSIWRDCQAAVKNREKKKPNNENWLKSIQKCDTYIYNHLMLSTWLYIFVIVFAGA